MLKFAHVKNNKEKFRHYNYIMVNRQECVGDLTIMTHLLRRMTRARESERKMLIWILNKRRPLRKPLETHKRKHATSAVGDKTERISEQRAKCAEPTKHSYY